MTLGRADLATQLARVHYPRRLPRVLSPEDVGRLIEAAPGPGLKYKAALSVAYGAGLRASEVVGLKVCDIDSKRMRIRVEQGKGRKDRHAMLSPQLLEVLRAWWRQCRSQGWLFPGRDPYLPITARQLNRGCQMAAEVAGLEHIAAVRKLLGAPASNTSTDNNGTGDTASDTLTAPCPCCGGRIRIIERFKRGETPRHQPSPPPIASRIDTS